MRLLRALCISELFCAVGLAQGVDLAAKYPATLDWSAKSRGLDWTCAKEDVWALKSFSYELGDKLKIKLGPSTVVFGRHKTNVVWAYLAPDTPSDTGVGRYFVGKIVTTESGNGELITSIWMRFHPALVGALFPPETVKGRGSEGQLVWARRNFAWKIRGCWQANNRPTVPLKKAIVFDIDTVEGWRRFYSVDTQAGTVEAESDFLEMGLKPLVPIDGKRAAEAFDTVWKKFDETYAKFVIKPHVDWNKLRDRYRPEAVKAKTGYEVADVIARMLAHLEDLHTFVYVGRAAGHEHEYVPGYTRYRPFNASWAAIRKIIGNVQDTGVELAWGKTADGIGYMNFYGLSRIDLTDAFDEVLDTLSGTWALIIDLRGNGGGDEMLAKSIAGRFAEKALIYSYSQYRNGPKHTDLGSKLPRAFESRGPWRYESPVVVLQGQATMSSAESFVFMLAQCPQVTTMGDRTAGASANPEPLALPGNIRVNVPRWLDLGPDKKPFENVGIPPQAPVKAEPGDFTATKDPVLEAALKHLRKTPQDKRKPGKRSK